MTEQRNVRSMGDPRAVPLRTLRLDPQNPRLPADVQGHGQEDLAVHIELGFDALIVAESIAAHGYFGSEPLIVVAGEDEESWTVVEGNRRLTALLGLVDRNVRAEFANPEPWEELAARCTVTPDDLIPVVVLRNRQAATPIIGFRHISGILQWQPYAQARYIARLVDVEGMSFAEVSKMIGVDRTKVANLYRDQAIAEQARRLGIETGPLEDSFSLLTVAMSTTKLRDHVRAPVGSRLVPGEDPIPPDKTDNLQELIRWVFGDGDVPPVIGDSREISRLGNVVSTDVGLSSLRNGDSLELALQKVKDADADPRQKAVSMLRAGRNALNGAVHVVADFGDDAEIAELVDEARAAADALLAALGRA